MAIKSMTCPVCTVAKNFIYICVVSPEQGDYGGLTAKLWYCPTCHVVIVEI